jgi:hypothetical protein
VSRPKRVFALCGIGLCGLLATCTNVFGPLEVDPPRFSVSAGSYSTDQSITLTDSWAGTTIYYTTDGSSPTTSSTLYADPIPISGNGTAETINAIAVKGGVSNSQVASAAYTINYSQMPPPQFSIPSGTYTTNQSVAITDPTSGATIYFTSDGTTPTPASAVYSSAIAVGGTRASKTAIKAIAVKPEMSTSNVASATYWISGTITTVAGNGTAGYTGDAGPATSAELNEPNGVAVDSSGNLYIADALNFVIRKTTASGTMSTFVGTGQGINGAHGLALDAAGNLYVANQISNQVFKVTPSGTLTIFAGSAVGISGYLGDGGPATSAELSAPQGVAVDASGNVYIVDTG